MTWVQNTTKGERLSEDQGTRLKKGSIGFYRNI